MFRCNLTSTCIIIIIVTVVDIVMQGHEVRISYYTTIKELYIRQI